MDRSRAIFVLKNCNTVAKNLEKTEGNCNRYFFIVFHFLEN